MAKKAGEIAPFQILSRIHFNLQVAVCPAKIWSVLRTYHNYINPNIDGGTCCMSLGELLLAVCQMRDSGETDLCAIGCEEDVFVDKKTQYSNQHLNGA